jgi:hypothetical protein
MWVAASTGTELRFVVSPFRKAVAEKFPSTILDTL